MNGPFRWDCRSNWESGAWTESLLPSVGSHFISLISQPKLYIFPQISFHCSLFCEEILIKVTFSQFSKSLLYCRKEKETSFRSGSFFIPKKLSPHCVWKEPTDHFFSKSSKSAKISHLFLISILWIMVLNASCLRLNNMIDIPLRWKRASKWRWDSVALTTLSVLCQLAPGGRGSHTGTYTRADYLEIRIGNLKNHIGMKNHAVCTLEIPTAMFNFKHWTFNTENVEHRTLSKCVLNIEH